MYIMYACMIVCVYVCVFCSSFVMMPADRHVQQTLRNTTEATLNYYEYVLIMNKQKS